MYKANSGQLKKGYRLMAKVLIVDGSPTQVYTMKKLVKE